MDQFGNLAFFDSGGDDQNAAVKSLLFSKAQELCSVLLSELDVKQHEINVSLAQSLKGFVDGTAVCRDLEVGLGCKQAGDTLAEKRVIIDNEDGDRILHRLRHELCPPSKNRSAERSGNSTLTRWARARDRHQN